MINFITYLVSTIFTYVMGIVSKKRGWNESIPIPVQNIFIGIIVFAISMVVVKIFHIDINWQEISNQILVSLGGAGTATLYYDTIKDDSKESE